MLTVKKYTNHASLWCGPEPLPYNNCLCSYFILFHLLVTHVYNFISSSQDNIFEYWKRAVNPNSNTTVSFKTLSQTHGCAKCHTMQRNSKHPPKHSLTHLTLSSNEILLFSFPLSFSLSSPFPLFLSLSFFSSFSTRSGCEGPVLDLIRRATNQVGI